MSAPTTARPNWLAARRDRTSTALDQCFAEGLTGHTVIAREGKLVKLQDGSTATEFVSCSYLGLESHPDLSEAVVSATRMFGVHLSSSRNRMRPSYLPELEELLARIYPGAAPCVFTSTSNVHLGVLPLLASGSLPSYPVAGEPHFLVDRTAHASMQVLRGIFEQFGPVSRFRSEDPASADAALAEVRAAGRTPIVLVDGVGSMNGLIPVAELAGLAAAAGGYLYVDDAHGISIDGRSGCGYAFDALGGALPGNVVLAGSLSKGFGGSGGFLLAASPEDVAVVRKLANPLVFGHSVMVPMMAANVAAARIHLSPEIGTLQDRLWANAARLDALTGGKLANSGLRSPIRGAVFGTEEDGLRTVRLLKERGIIMLPAFYPTVPQGSSLLRFALSSLHTDDELALLASTLEEIGGYGSGTGPQDGPERQRGESD
ncbi:7-keto-8-aminopelargonate synthetase-like enzyme [Streptomyces sp. Amel2xB2]|uniref:aminotransferase class I/II-fold pyridoxal phosphate-dependent enzyme n=1 Tax=Streptomyces sp. Amel2xB2 TaxID=1305829 RepID=UPI000DB9730C|nr:aminotransferase class I/II-fold pyridoxal phosphate-dependent enzyme [Streptomyces sp. Amel2xB2]RAJ60490.1 7-keto-8-aminopelargonate synthetase-like enzyme [Streptomyces sp. Amel2xB2]